MDISVFLFRVNFTFDRGWPRSAVAVLIRSNQFLENDCAAPTAEIISRHRVDRRSLSPLDARHGAVEVSQHALISEWIETGASPFLVGIKTIRNGYWKSSSGTAMKNRCRV